VQQFMFIELYEIYKNSVCGKNTELLNGTVDGAYFNHCAEG